MSCAPTCLQRSKETHMNSRSRPSAAISVALLGCMLSACVSSGAGPLNREAAWIIGGHIHTRWSMEDALEQGLSRKVTGEDLHSHQIGLRRRSGQTIYQQMALAQNIDLCTVADESRDWAALKCRAWIPAKEQPLDVSCDLRRCTVVQFAPFVLREEGLLAAISNAAELPCGAIPDFRVLQERFHIRQPRGGLTMHRADVSQYWLYCDTESPVRGRSVPTSNPDVFVVRWDRASLRELPSPNN